MKPTKSVRAVAAAVLSLALLALFLGCSSASTKYAGQTLTVKVTSFDGETVAAVTGQLSDTTGEGMPNGMTMPQNSSPNAPGMPTGSAPAMPSGVSMPQIPSGFEVPNGASIPQNAGSPTVGASGNWPDGGNFMPGMNGAQSGTAATFTSSGETVSFSLADNTAIISESSGSAVFTSASEITIGSVLQVLFGSNGKPTAVIIKTVSGNSGSGNANFGGSSTVTNGTSANTLTEDSNITGTSYKSSGDDENALRIDGAKVNLTDITVNKSGGSSSNTENGDFYGQNAALLALNGSTVTIKNARL